MRDVFVGFDGEVEQELLEGLLCRALESLLFLGVEGVTGICKRGNFGHELLGAEFVHLGEVTDFLGDVGVQVAIENRLEVGGHEMQGPIVSDDALRVLEQPLALVIEDL